MKANDMTSACETRGAAWNADGSIDCELRHPALGWIPFTARADDVEPSGRELHAALQRGVVRPYEAPLRTETEQLAALPPVTHAQLVTALILSGALTETEGVAWISGELPASLSEVIGELPSAQRLHARLRMLRPLSVSPGDPLIAAWLARVAPAGQGLVKLFTAAAAL